MGRHRGLDRITREPCNLALACVSGRAVAGVFLFLDCRSYSACSSKQMAPNASHRWIMLGWWFPTDEVCVWVTLSRPLVLYPEFGHSGATSPSHSQPHPGERPWPHPVAGVPGYLWFRTLLELGSTFGWRRSNLLDLRVNQVDILRGTVRLEPGTTKNDRGLK